MRTCGSSSPAASASCRATSTTTRRSIACAGRRGAGPRARHDGQPRVLPVDPAEVVPGRRQLKRSGLTEQHDGQWRRVVIEKPFGSDLQSARELNDVVASVFPPDSVFRIDHYRQGDGPEHPGAALREPVVRADLERQLRRPRADHHGRGHRRGRPAGYYDGIGAARDVIQNHLLQLLALTAMEEPISFDAADLRAEKEKILAAVRLPGDPPAAPPAASTGGWQGGEKVVGFLDEEGMNPESTTETYAAMKLLIGTPLGRRAVLPARRQAAWAPRHRDRRGLQAGAAAGVRRQPDVAARPERARDPRAARRGRHDPVRLEGAGRRHAGARRHDGLRLRPRLHRGEPRGVRAPHPRRAARRPPLFPPRRRSSCLEDPRPDRGVLGDAGPARAVPARNVGAGARPTSSSHRDGRTWRRP